MGLSFDIAADELPVFTAEVDEQIQVLEEGLLRLEQDDSEPELLQAVFRAAHTIKGSAGMIGHERLAHLTHTLETVLDGLRKDTIELSSALVDVCLDAVDDLRLLREEVMDGVMRVDDIEPIVARINAAADATSATGQPSSKPATESFLLRVPSTPVMDDTCRMAIAIDIAPESIAPAARAFQIVLALQPMGTIVSMEPTQADIEAARPVKTLSLFLDTPVSVEEILRAIETVSDIAHISIDGVTGFTRSEKEEKIVVVSDQVTPEIQEVGTTKLGEYLLQKGIISKEQLAGALRIQAAFPQPRPVLGEILVKMGLVSQSVIVQAVAGQVKELKQALQEQKSPGEKQKTRVVDQTVRTSVEKLDRLMNLAGELITSRNRLYRVRSELEGTYHGDMRMEDLSLTVVQIGRITDQLQEEIMEIRMLPVGNVFNKYPRLIRDLARKAGKSIDLEIYGEETELDRTVIERISDPLVHLMRNCVDHGIASPEERSAVGKSERGRIQLIAEHKGGQIIITVSDDGRGIDTERLKKKAIQRGLLSEQETRNLSEDEAVDLIFKPGLSTAKQLSDISGRGVGMDIVRTNIESIGGSVLVETTKGSGSRFQIVLPLTLAIVPTLLVGVNTMTYAVPLTAVTETLRIPVSSIRTIKDHPAIVLRDSVLPLVHLAEALGFEKSVNDSPYRHVVAIRAGKIQFGLVVDELMGEEELMLKSIEELVGRTRGVSGAAILGDGQVALILDIQGILQLVGMKGMRLKTQAA